MPLAFQTRRRPKPPLAEHRAPESARTREPPELRRYTDPCYVEDSLDAWQEVQEKIAREVQLTAGAR